MTKSALQIARAAYQPKLPKALKDAVKVKEGEPTQSVADQEAIKAVSYTHLDVYKRQVLRYFSTDL